MKFSKSACNRGDGKFLQGMRGSQEWRERWEIFKVLYIVGRGVLTLLFYEDPLYCLTHPFSKFCPPPPPTTPTSLPPRTHSPTALSVVMFLWLNGWSHHIWCVILVNNDMDLYMSSLGTLVPEGPWCLFYATRRQIYRSLTHNVVFYWYSDLISNTYNVH